MLALGGLLRNPCARLGDWLGNLPRSLRSLGRVRCYAPRGIGGAPCAVSPSGRLPCRPSARAVGVGGLRRPTGNPHTSLLAGGIRRGLSMAAGFVGFCAGLLHICPLCLFLPRSLRSLGRVRCCAPRNPPTTHPTSRGLPPLLRTACLGRRQTPNTQP